MQQQKLLADSFAKMASQYEQSYFSSIINEQESANSSPIFIQKQAARMLAYNELRMFWDRLAEDVGYYEWNENDLGVEALHIVETACELAGFASGAPHMVYLDMPEANKKGQVRKVARDVMTILPLDKGDKAVIQAYMKALGITVSLR